MANQPTLSENPTIGPISGKNLALNLLLGGFSPLPLKRANRVKEERRNLNIHNISVADFFEKILTAPYLPFSGKRGGEQFLPLIVVSSSKQNCSPCPGPTFLPHYFSVLLNFGYFCIFQVIGVQ